MERSPAEQFSLYVENIQPKEEDFLKAGDWLVSKIRKNALSGLDYQGQPFAPYSPNYSNRKGSSSPSLYSKGNGPHMLDALESKYDDNTSSLEVGIFDNPELAMRAKVQNEGARIPTTYGKGLLSGGLKKKKGKKPILEIPARNFMGASEEDLVHMQEIIMGSANERVSKEI